MKGSIRPGKDNGALKLSIVIPVYNNEGSLEELVRRVLAVCAKITEDFELVLVDDGSRDSSPALLREISNTKPSVVVLSLTRNFGQHAAISAGLEHADGDVFVLMDADLQEPPEAIPEMVDVLVRSNSEIVFSRRQNDKARLKKRFTSDLYFQLFSRISKSPVPQGIGTQRAFTRKVKLDLQRFGEYNILYGPLMNFTGHSFEIIDVPHRKRTAGKSGYTFAKRVELAFNSLVSYTDLPHRFMLWFGIIIFFGSIVYGIVVVLQSILFGSLLPDGIALLIVLVTFIGGALSMIMGLNGMYVFRVYQEVLRRPRYLVREIFDGRNQSVTQHDEPKRKGQNGKQSDR